MVAKPWSSQLQLPCPELGSGCSHSVRHPVCFTGPCPPLGSLCSHVCGYRCYHVVACVQRSEGNHRRKSFTFHLETGSLLFFTMCIRLAASGAWEECPVPPLISIYCYLFSDWDAWQEGMLCPHSQTGTPPAASTAFPSGFLQDLRKAT